jgi:hypothetical protein
MVYQGHLSASANKSKTKEVFDIRRKLSPQLEMLWSTNPALKVLEEVGWARDPNARGVGQYMTPQGEPPPRVQNLTFPGMWVPLFGPMPVGSSEYRPLVRKSLYLACDLEILFLRQEDPGNLVTQGGDIDGRIKTLLDALRMPDVQEQQAAGAAQENLHVLMESDSLVTGLSIETERLLLPQTTYANEVHLVIEAKVKVLQVIKQNMCLL